MFWVERFDVSADVFGPIIDDGCIAAAAARLIGELPGEDRARLLVPIYDELDVFLVSFLGCGIGVEAIVVGAERASIGVDATQIVVIVVKWEN